MERGVTYFLFIIIAEGLSTMVGSTVELGHLSTISPCTSGDNISLLQYANDTLLFCEPNMQELINVRRILICFSLVSGLKVNFKDNFV